MQERPDWTSAPAAEWEQARNRERLIRPLAEQPSATRADVEVAAKELGLSRSFTYKLIARYKRHPVVSSLLSAKRGRPAESRILNQDKETILDDAIQDFYLRPERPRMADLIREIGQRCNERNVQPPNYRTVLRRVLAIDRRLALQRRYGAKAADAQCKVVRASPWKDLGPLEVMQVDHTPVDVIVVDEQERLPLGRPWLSLAIDVSSRVITGFAVSMDPPSTVSVALVLTHSVMPKDVWLADRGIEMDWPVAGIPRGLHLDNAKEFESAALVRGCQEYGIELDYRPPGRPHFGGHIERLIGTMMGAVHLLPGTTFASVADKGAYDSQSKAALTLPELERWLALQIGVYHHSVHSSLGSPPINVWKGALDRLKQAIRQPPSREQFFIDFLPGEKRTLQRDGIRLFNIRYWDNILSPLIGRANAPVTIKYDPRNLSRIYLRDPGGSSFWPIPYRDLGLPPISLWELQEARRRLKEIGRRAIDENTMFAAIREQRRIVEQAQKTSRARRKREKQQQSERLSSADSSPSSEKEAGDVKPFDVEEWS